MDERRHSPAAAGGAAGEPTTDREYARRFERGAVRNEDFHHREHLRVAWAYLEESDSATAACARMRAAIRRFAAAAGHPGKYHETMTVFWVLLLAHVRERSPRARALADVLPDHPYLLDKDAPLAYYSRARLHGDDARLAWLPPDLKPIDPHAAPTRSGDPPRDPPPGPVPDGTRRAGPHPG